LDNYVFGSSVIFSLAFTGQLTKIEVDITNFSNSLGGSVRAEIEDKVPNATGAYGFSYVGGSDYIWRHGGIMDFSGHLNMNLLCNETTGFYYAKKVRLYGTGTNPFGASNCS